jgi:hypothetical protein
MRGYAVSEPDRFREVRRGRIYRAVSEFGSGDANRLCLSVSGGRRNKKTVRRVANRLSTGTNTLRSSTILVSIEEEPKKNHWTKRPVQSQRMSDFKMSVSVANSRTKKLFSRSEEI